MDTISLANSSNGLEQNLVALSDSTFPNSHSFLSEIHSHSSASLSTPLKCLTFLQDGTAGNDLLEGDRSKTTLHGLAGNDLILGSARQASVLFGNDGNDQIQGGRKNDVLNGGAGRDYLIGDRGNDSLVGGSDNDHLLGGKGNDELKGHSGRDRLWGGKGSDRLHGGSGIDRLHGGRGNDVLNDYEGGDRLTGGRGADRFGVGSPLTTEASIITDFRVGIDQVKILRLGATFEALTFQDSCSGTLVRDQERAIAILQGVDAKHLSADSFVFGDAQLANTLQKNLDQFMEANLETTGLSSAVFAPDGTLWVGFAGVADRESQTPVDSESILGVGSITKPMVATTVLQLQEERGLNLDDTLSQWLPDWANKIPNSDRITIRQMLNHTSGIRDYLNEPDLIERGINDPTILSQSFTTEEILSYIVDKPALFEPGQAYSYSNSEYLLLGEIIEKATGSTLVSQLRERIFEPLGMSQTFFAPQEQVEGNLTHSYADLDGDGQLDDLNESLSLTGAAGGVVSTAADLAKFSQALFQGELLTPNTLQAMVNDKVETNIEGLYYGSGVSSTNNPDVGRIWGHNGATFGWQGEMYYLPDRHITATVVAIDPNENIIGSLVLENLEDTAQQYPDLLEQGAVL